MIIKNFDININYNLLFSFSYFLKKKNYFDFVNRNFNNSKIWSKINLLFNIYYFLYYLILPI